LAEAEAALCFSNKSKDGNGPTQILPIRKVNISIPELISDYMNGPRLLSNDRLSYAVISSTSSSEAPDHIDYSLFVCATHFIGDGAALNQSAHDLLCILTSTQSDEELKKELDEQPDWVRNCNLVHMKKD
jgi:hypothetical protein